MFLSPRARRWYGPLSVVLAVVCSACLGDTGPTSIPVPVALVWVTSNIETAGVGQTLTVTARVTTSSGASAPGVSVVFAVTVGGGRVASATVVTDASGRASSLWTLGTGAGANTLTASVGTLPPIEFGVIGTAGPPAAITVVAGIEQNATVGNAVSVRPAVVVKDSYGNLVSGATVTFVVTGGGGLVTGAVQVTDALGIATIGTWTLGTRAGPNTLSATVAALPPAQFSAIGKSGAPFTLTVATGTGQTAVVGSAVATPPAVQVMDANGNPVPDIPVTFAIASGGGAVTGAAAVTDASGIATLGSWVLGHTAGPGTLTAAYVGLTPATFTALAVADVPATIAVLGGAGQTSVIGAVLPLPLTVVVTDRFGNPVAGVPVVFTVGGGGGGITGGPATTNDQGIAVSGAWTLGSVIGVQSVSATVAAVSPAVFSAVALSLPSLRIQVTGWGNAIDPDGFTVSTGGSTFAIPWNGVTTLNDLQPSSVTVALSGVASHCSADVASQSAVLAGGTTTTVRFAVGCFGELAIAEYQSAANVRLGYMNGSGAIATLAPAPGRQVAEEWSPDGARILYTTNQNGNNPVLGSLDIATVSRLGGSPTWLVTSVDDETVPRWSPDGTRVAYMREYLSNGFWGNVHVVNANGTGDVAVLSSLTWDLDPVWLPGGSAVAFGCSEIDPAGGVCRAFRSGGGLAPIVANTGGAYHLVASPQRDWIAFESTKGGTQGMWVVPSAGGTPTPLIPGMVNFGAVWSPSGSRLAVATVEPDQSYGLRVVDRNGAHLSPNLVSFASNEGGVGWSPDGGWLAISAVTSTGQNIFVMRPDGSAVRQITFGPTPIGLPFWRPTVPFVQPPPWAVLAPAPPLGAALRASGSASRATGSCIGMVGPVLGQILCGSPRH